ncbi:MAG: ParB/RepB/Spo0J family partition protein [Clostridia bacterium]|nr:ParB/RepB/Spo0J family partition protein [Clostridia bacterium]
MEIVLSKPEEYEGEKGEIYERVHQIDTNLIVPNPNQPRKQFAEEAILKLADSIRQFGIIQPLTVRKAGDIYELVSGERRLRASKELGLKQVPCIIVSISEEKSAEISIIENLLREDLNIFEQAMAIEVLIDTYNLTQEQVAERLSNSQSFVANKLRLLRLSQEEREIILSNKLSERHARSLLRIFDTELRRKVLLKIISDSLTVAQTEELIDDIVQKPSKPQSREKTVYKDIKSFYCALNRAIDSAKNSNLSIKSRKIVGESFTEVTIIIPNDELKDIPNSTESNSTD